MTDLGEKLQGLAKRHADSIRKRVGQHWIALRSEKKDRVFAEIRPHRRRVEVFILPRPKDLVDPRGLAKRAPPTQGWGWFRSRLSVTTMDQVESAFRLIRQSYEYRQRQPNGRSPRHQRARRKQTV